MRTEERNSTAENCVYTNFVLIPVFALAFAFGLALALALALAFALGVGLP